MRAPAAIPPRAGIGLRAPHYRAVLETWPDIGWVEVHSENYFGAGGQPLHFLERVRERYPLSLHGVGLSLGSAGGIAAGHLERLRALVERFEPGLVSEHLSWSAAGGRHLNDLLPLPYGPEALAAVCANVGRAQDCLGRQILVENISSYLRLAGATLDEPGFLAEVARRSGCGILLDVNNVHVSSVNLGFDPVAYIDAIPAAAVREMHLAGFDTAGELLIDTHGRRVAGPVWALYRHALARFPGVPTLVEWDTDLPPLEVLLDEARTADRLTEECHALAG